MYVIIAYVYGTVAKKKDGFVNKDGEWNAFVEGGYTLGSWWLARVALYQILTKCHYSFFFIFISASTWFEAMLLEHVFRLKESNVYVQMCAVRESRVQGWERSDVKLWVEQVENNNTG